MTTPPTTDASGRVVIQESDDRDTPFPLVSNAPANLLGINAYSQVFRWELVRARRGHLFISANIATNAAFANQYVCMELHVLAFIVSAPTIAMRTILDQNLNLVEFEWDEPDTYSALAIEARENVDGAGSSVATGIVALTLSASGFYWR